MLCFKFGFSSIFIFLCVTVTITNYQLFEAKERQWTIKIETQNTPDIFLRIEVGEASLW